MAMNLPVPGKRFVIGVPYAWLIVFFFLPFLILLYISFVDMGADISPFKPIWDPETGVLQLKYENYLDIFRTEEGAPLFKTLYVDAYVRSIKYALLTAIFCLIIGYPFAYFIARSPASVRPALLLMVMLPFWTSFLLRVYAWKGLLADQGVINRFMMGLGITSEPIPMLYTDVSMLVGMTYVYLPFMVLPLYSALDRLDKSLLEASLDLGAGHLRTIFKVVVPLAIPGIASGVLITFIPALGAYLTPDLLGGPDSQMIANVIERQFKRANDWPFGAAMSFLLMYLTFIAIAIQAVLNRKTPEAKG